MQSIKKRCVLYVQCVNIFRMYYGLLGHMTWAIKTKDKITIKI